MQKIFSLLVFFIIFSFISQTAVFAAEQSFLADYRVQYAIAPTGVAIVTQNITLTNQTTAFYPTQYSVIIDSILIKNVIAYDKKGIITPKILQKDGKTEILLNFNERVAGKGKSLDFTLRFENEELAKKNGELWEVYIPGIAKTSDINTYEVTLQTPQNFDDIAYLSPQPAKDNTWTKEQMTSGGIRAAYGFLQKYKLDLLYFLENKTLNNQRKAITLPVESAYQKIFLKKIEPEPDNVIEDRDGNLLAFYDLYPGQKIKINLQASVWIYLHPRKDFIQKEIKIDDYLISQKYWETNDPQIIETAKSLTTPREIYDFVVNYLTYDFNSDRNSESRKGAVRSLNEKAENISCEEFTDLFIAISRAVNIPARRAVGYAFTTNKRLRPLSLIADVLHAWPEYYDQINNTWVPVDPTWGNTSNGQNYFDFLDFDHITFAYNGFSSEAPQPAGSLRSANKLEKIVNVSVSDENEIEKTANNFHVNFKLPKYAISGLPQNGKIIIQNQNQNVINNLQIVIKYSDINEPYVYLQHSLPPWGKVEIPVSNKTIANFGKLKRTINVNINGLTNAQYSYQIISVHLIALVTFIISLVFILLALAFNK